jgi:hypothetical protein
MIGPAPVLALLLALLDVSLYVLVRGRAGSRVPILFLVAWLGAWTGDALGARLGLRLLNLGDFHFIEASILAWLGIGLVAVIASLAPASRRGGPAGERGAE